MKINQEQAKEFLEEIKEGEKVAIVHHDDLDGFASAILLFDYLIEKGISSKTFAAKISAAPLGDYDLGEFEKVIFVDLAVEVVLNDLVEMQEKNILVIDHHPKTCDFPKSVLEFNLSEKGYFPASKLCYELVGGKQWLAVLGVLADKGDLYEENKDFLKEFFESGNDKKEFSKMVKSLICYLVVFEENPQKAFEPLQKIDSFEGLKSLKEFYGLIQEEVDFFIEDFETNRIENGDVFFYYFEPKQKVKRPLAHEIGEKYPDRILVFVSPSGKAGFLGLGGRNGVGEVGALDILKKGIVGLEGAKVGGHSRGCGEIIQAKDLEKFKQNILKA